MAVSRNPRKIEKVKKMGKNQFSVVEFKCRKGVQENLTDVTTRAKNLKGFSESQGRVLEFLYLSSLYLYLKEQGILSCHIIYIQIGKLKIKRGTT